MTSEQEARFWAKVDKTATCWIWRGGFYPHGYGRFVLRHGVQRVAHRAAYELVVGPIPVGLTLDHLCRVRACVNPRHLEPVTLAVNVLRGIGPTAENARRTTCVNGHPFTDENTYRAKSGKRACRECARAITRRWQMQHGAEYARARRAARKAA